jgi:hypothetical protein
MEGLSTEELLVIFLRGSKNKRLGIWINIIK